MSGFKDQKRIDDLRQRLYDRGHTPEKTKRHELSDDPQPVNTDWQRESAAEPTPQPEAPSQPTPQQTPTHTPEPEPESEPTPADTLTATAADPEPSTDTMPRKKKRTYRSIVLALSLLTLIVVVGLSSVFLFMGGNNISPRNIDVAINGPFAIGGGTEMPLQVGITNQNTAPIESATLIMKYPPGTRSVGDQQRDLFEERLPLESIDAGETINVPVRVAVFGEENEEKTVSATVEYRLEGSNGTFFKDAEPFTFKLNSAPVSVSVDSVRKVASGQETDITLTVKSNSPNPLTDVLVSADYPTNFDYTSAEPSPLYGQNTWMIETLEPEAAETITIRGAVLGQQDDEFVMRFTVGKPEANNQFQMGSVLATGEAEFLIERPFIGINVAVNGDGDGSAVLESGRPATVRIEVTNTLDESVYDMYVEAALVGTAVREEDVRVQNGFYNSSENVVRWDVTSESDFEEVAPGQRQILTFDFQPLPQENTPTFDIEVDAYARRVSESSAAEQLIGSAVTNARISTALAVNRELGRNTSVFADSGPVPPIAEEPTTYTITLEVQNGSNDVLDAEVMTSIPQFVSWLDAVSGDGSMTYNPVSKTIVWNIGAIDANERKRTTFQVEFLPSLSQIGTTPALLGQQRLRATDRFTGSVVRADAPPVSADLPREDGYGRGSGEVRDPDEVEDEEEQEN